MPATSIHTHGKGKWEIKVDAQNIGFDGFAKANGCVEVNKAIKERATRYCYERSTEDPNHTQQISTYAEFQGIFWASCLRRWGNRR